MFSFSRKFFSTLSSSSSSSSSFSEVYPLGVQVMHWTMGGTVLASLLCVQGAIQTKDKKLKGDLMFYHKSFGLLSFGLLFPRLVMRGISKIPGHLPGSATWEKILNNISHTLLYAFLIGMPTTGVVMGYYSGKGLPFFWQTLSGAEKADGEIAKQAFKIHKNVGTYMQYLIPFHIGAVGYHGIVKGTNILPRIVPK
jgi:cytochrome b561